MNNEVNLISSRKKDLVKQEKIAKTVRFVAFASMGVIVLLAVIFFFLNQDTTYVELSKKEKLATTGLTLSNDKIAKLLLVQNRLIEINKVLAKRSNYDTVISDMLLGIPQEVTIDSFALTSSSVTMNISSDSLSAINTVVSFLTNKVTQKKLIKTLDINDVSADAKNGKYSVGIVAKFL